MIKKKDDHCSWGSNPLSKIFEILVAIRYVETIPAESEIVGHDEKVLMSLGNDRAWCRAIPYI